MRQVQLLLILIFIAFLSYAFIGHNSTQRINCTELNGDGCVCHRVDSSPSVKVWVTGPDTVFAGQTYQYRMFLTGGPAIGGGYNVACRFGTLGLADTVSVLIDNEITQRIPLRFATVRDTVFWVFNYTAPDTVEKDTIYSCGLSINFDGRPSDADWWAFGPKHPVIILPNPIPVEFLSVQAHLSGNEVLLEWVTASETNNNYFEIEKRNSESGLQWQSIGTLPGNGTKTEISRYQFKDISPGSGSFEYRIKQVDYSGDFSYSQSVQIDVKSTVLFQLHGNYPNPFNPETTIEFTLTEKNFVNLKIYSINGEFIEDLAGSMYDRGLHRIKFDAKDLPGGIYFYRLEIQGKPSAIGKAILIK